MSDTNNELASFNAKQSNTTFPPLTGYCDYRYQTPVVATRTVGYSQGSAASLTQTFTYNTLWNPITGSWVAPSSDVTVGDERVWQSKTTTVQTENILPSGTAETSQTVYQYGSVYQPLQPDSQGQMPAQLAVESSVAYYDWGNTTTPLKTEYKAWYDQFDIAADTTVLSNKLGTEDIYCYTGGNSWALIREKDEYNTAPSTPYAQSTTTSPTTLPSSCSYTTAPKSTVYGYYGSFYLPNQFGGPVYPNQFGYFGLPNQIVTYAAGTRIAETDAYYDGFSVLNPPYNTNTIPATPPAATPVASNVTISSSIHDETNYGASSTIMRGNPTQVVRWANVGTSPITTYTYDQTGQVRSKTDACGNSSCSDMPSTTQSHTTSYSYNDSFTTLSSGANGAYTPPLSTNAYLTKITDALGHATSFTYDYHNGQLTSSTDPNSQTTNYVYNDVLNRLTLSKAPDNGQTSVAFYDPAPGASDSIPTVTTSELLSTGGPSKVTIASMDGMEHVTSTELETAPEGPHYTNANYDGMGLPYQTWNPFISTSDTTYGISVHTYDALGRKTKLQNPDGTSSTWCYSAAGSGCPGVLATGYSSAYPPVSWVDSYDEVGNHHQDLSDGFGRLIAVMEPNGTTAAPSMETDYSYDLLNNLLSVQQWGGAPNSAGARSRSFTYDSLSRLLCSSNPENSYASCPTSATSSHVAGTTSYSYDANGNLATKTDARGITTSYTYDVLNRVVAKSYSDGTNSACYRYDVAARTGATQYLVGHLTGEWTQSGACPSVATTAQIPSTVTTAQAYMKYDAVGRLQSEQYCTPQSCNYSNGVSAIYDLVGDTTSLTYPDGRVVSQVFDSAARVNSISSSLNGTSTPNLGLITYDAFNHPISWTMGSGTGATTATSAYNKRVELTSLGYAQGTNTALWGKSYTWTNNANLLTTKDAVSGVVRQFGYDTLDRLVSAQDLKGTSSGSGQTRNTSDQTQTNVLEDSQAIGSSGWSISQASVVSNSVAAPDGTMTASSLTAVSNSTGSYALDGVVNPALYDNLSMAGSVWLRTPTGTLTATVSIVYGPSNGFGPLVTQPVTLTPTWQQVNLSAVARNVLTGLGLQIGGSSFTSGEIDVWGPQLQIASTAQSVTNYAPYSQQIGGSLWSGYCAANSSSNMTLNTSAVTAPDGSKTATSFVIPSSVTCNASDPLGSWENVAGGLIAGQTYTVSVWLQGAAGGEAVNFGLNDCASTNITLTKSWERYSISFPSISSATANCSTGSRGFQVLDNSQPSATFYAWGAQTEASSSVGQYVATLDSPVTATADSSNLLPSSSQVGGPGWLIYNGTVAANSTSVAAPDGSYTADVFTATAGSTAGSIDVVVANPSLYDGATVTASIYLRAANTPQTLTINILNNSASGPTTISTLNAAVTTTWQRFDLPPGTNANGLTALEMNMGSSSNSQFVSTNPIYIVSVGQRP